MLLCLWLLFVIVAETLAIKIRNSTAIEGIKVASENGENYIKICQLFHYFGNQSGLKLNINKTGGMWLGRYKERNCNKKTAVQILLLKL